MPCRLYSWKEYKSMKFCNYLEPHDKGHYNKMLGHGCWYLVFNNQETTTCSSMWGTSLIEIRIWITWCLLGFKYTVECIIDSSQLGHWSTIRTRNSLVPPRMEARPLQGESSSLSFTLFNHLTYKSLVLSICFKMFLFLLKNFLLLCYENCKECW